MGNSQSGFIQSVYKRNKRGFSSFNHALRVDVKEYNIDYTEIKFNEKDMPYFKLALVDRHLDEISDDESYHE